MMMTTDLSESERLLLAREAAADSYRAGGYVYDQTQIRKAFSDGWDAALEWIAQQPNTEADKWSRYAKELERDIEESERHCAQYHS